MNERNHNGGSAVWARGAEKDSQDISGNYPASASHKLKSLLQPFQVFRSFLPLRNACEGWLGECFPCRFLISPGCTSGLVSGLWHVGEATNMRLPGLLLTEPPVLRRAPGHVHPDPGLSEQRPGAGRSRPSLWAVSRFPPGCALACRCCAKPGGSLHAPHAAAPLPVVRLIWCTPGKAACSTSGQAPVSTQPPGCLAW